jgi:lysyl-tRNA synthetase, class II
VSGGGHGFRSPMPRLLAPLRPERRASWLPPVVAAAAALTAAVNAVSVLLPDVAWRARAVRRVEPVEVVPIFHALALPLSACLLVAAFYLARRRRRAWQLAVAVLAGLGAVNLAKGLDVEEALLSWALAGVLWWGRDAFRVRHDPIRLSSALWRLPALLGAAGAASLGVVTLAAPPGAGAGAILRATFDLLTWSKPPFPFTDESAWIPTGIALTAAAALLAAAYLLFRPLAAPRSLPGPEARRAAHRLVREHGSDTLAYFKLRRDKHYFMSRDERAFAGYRIENGVLLVSGDPVGPDEALPALVRELCAFAEVRGLRLGVLGASEARLPLWQDAGLRAFYIGDEAVVDTAAFSLEGRAVRKVRQSVSRLEAAGYACEGLPVSRLPEEALAELEAVSARWRGSAAERGFCMALDSLRGPHAAATTVVLARDAAGTIRGFLHLVPTFGRAAASLSAMRRDRDTPNGLMEFLVVRGIEHLRGAGIAELSLNFAAFARVLHDPSGRGERLLARVLALANPYFQIESLYRFNAKFFPRWEPRYLLYEGALGLPRAGLAAMRIEGQLPARRG